MKKIIIAVLVFVPVMFLTSCAVSEAAYHPGYNNTGYVYSAGYYGYRPYVSNYYGGWGNVGYWRGYRGYSTSGWNAAAWQGAALHRGYGWRHVGHRGWHVGHRGWHGAHHGWHGGHGHHGRR